MGWNPLLAVPLGLLVALTVAPVLRHLPRVADAPDYAALATTRFRASAGIATAFAAAAVMLWAPPAHWVAWAALVLAGVPAVCIDAATTWLPLPFARAGWVLAAAGVVVAAAHSPDPPSVLLAAVLGALLVGGFFHLVWALSGAIGYGDVRLMVTVGAVTALGGATLVVAAVFLGTLLGALAGIGHRMRGRRGAFPYGPVLLAGAFAALPLAAWAA
ncbi:hypothetical protein [Propioniciclava sp.]|uniref:hypothetical protein n=1 Tax=Propioniciclava sp. TaxID=2038686 RepID=UPI00261BF23B|nr:hypothetical protein [Propioniciclava sp.]